MIDKSDFLDLNKNFSTILNIIKSERQKSMTEFSEELETSRSALQEYLSGAGNPNLTTIEHISKKLNVSSCFCLWEISMKNSSALFEYDRHSCTYVQSAN